MPSGSRTLTSEAKKTSVLLVLLYPRFSRTRTRWGIMRLLANLFLLLFILFAIATAALDLVPALPPSSLFMVAFGLLKSLCLGIAFILYNVSAFNRHLPKLLLYPLFAWLLWGVLDYWPLPQVTGQYYHFCAGTAQLLTIILLLRRNRRENECSPLLVPSQFTGPFFSGRSLLLFVVINILITPLLLIIFGWNAAARLADEGSAGFVQLKPDGIYMSEKSYRHEAKTIRLVAMIHLARPEYYADIVKTIPREKTLILLEGVSDDRNLLHNRFSYGNLAEFLGLTSQSQLHLPGRVISRQQLTAEPPDDTLGQGLDMIRADIDISAFDPHTIEVLDALAKYVLNAESPLAGYLAFNQWVADNEGPDIDKTIMTDLLDKRNVALLSYLPEALERYDTLVIPWGALHMKGLEQALLARGFYLVKTSRHLSIDFGNLPYKQMWEKLLPQE